MLNLDELNDLTKFFMAHESEQRRQTNADNINVDEILENQSPNLAEQVADPRDLVYKDGSPVNPREAIKNPSIVPETFDDSQNPRPDLRHDDER